MLYVTNKGIDKVQDYSGKNNILSIKNAIYVKCKNGYYTYLKSGNWLDIEKAFSPYYHYLHYFYFIQIKEILVDDEEKYRKLALNKFNDAYDIQFKGFYFTSEFIL